MLSEEVLKIDLINGAFLAFMFFPHFRPCDVIMGFFSLFFHKLGVQLHMQKMTFETKHSLD